MKTMSPPHRVAAYLLGAGASGTLVVLATQWVLSSGIVAMRPGDRLDWEEIMLYPGQMMLWALAAQAVAAVTFYVTLYRMWAAIEQGIAPKRSRTAPGRAVGFLFIPGFNLYWMFVAIHDWAWQFNFLARLRGLQFRAAAGPGLAYCLATLLIVLSGLGGITLPFLRALTVVGAAAQTIAAAVFLWQGCRAVNHIVAWKAGGSGLRADQR